MRNLRTTATLLLIAAPTLLLSTGCESSGYDELAVDCNGKCDGLDKIKSLMRDARELDVDDLVRIGAPYVTDEINDLLAFGDYGGMKLADTAVFDGDQINTLSSGLAAHFGERELSTEINLVRREHLERSSDTVFAESAFKIELTAGAKWTIETGGFGSGNVKIGFADSSLEARVVAAYEDPTDAILQGPLRALRETGRSGRGFVLPRSLDDIQDMRPGELVATRGSGTVGMNLGVGVPILIASPLAAIEYLFVLSAGLRTQLEGTLDVQVMKLAGDEVVIDVGIEKARIKGKKIAIDDAWGVQGLLEAEVSVAGISLDLGRLVERALEKQLNRHLDFVSARAETSSLDVRMSVTRLRFDLAVADPELAEAAIAQAMRGDVRLAQALAYRGDAGFETDFDMSRGGTASTSFAGAKIFGMEFFVKKIEEDGNVLVQTPGGVRSILFNTLHRSSGFFIKRSGFSRIGLSSLRFKTDGSAAALGEVNLIAQVDEGDKAMERDKLVDQIDSVIVGIAGIEALQAIEKHGNAIEIMVEEMCAGTTAFDSCPVNALNAVNNGGADGAKAKAEAARDAQAALLDPKVRDMFVKLVDLRIKAQSVYEQKAQLTGPGVSITTDIHFDDAALTEALASGAGTRYRQAVIDLLSATEVNRENTDLSTQRNAIAGADADELGELAAIVDNHSKRYRQFREAETAAIETIGDIGARAIEVRFEVGADQRPMYEEAAAQSLAEAQSLEVRTMFDSLRQAASGFGPHKEQVAAYALMGLVADSSLEVGVDIDMNTDDTILFWREPYRAAQYPKTLDLYGKGSAVELIDGGLFSVDELIELQ